MNERIRELAEISGITTNLHPEALNKISHSLEKFARLVVTECIEQLEISNVMKHGALDDEIEILREYFRVEYK